MYYFYLWRNAIVENGEIIHRTCFGITGNLNRRARDYEGHCGHDVQFERVWESEHTMPIRELEQSLKIEAAEFRFKDYEWIIEDGDLDFQYIVDWVTTEVEDFPSINRLYEW